MEGDFNTIREGVRVLGLVAAVFHFLVGFVIYRDIIRINKVLKTKRSGMIRGLAVFYILTLLVIIFLFGGLWLQ